MAQSNYPVLLLNKISLDVFPMDKFSNHDIHKLNLKKFQNQNDQSDILLYNKSVKGKMMIMRSVKLMTVLQILRLDC